MRVMAIQKAPAEDKSITVEVRGIQSKTTITEFIAAPTNDGKWMVADKYGDQVGHRFESAEAAFEAALSSRLYVPVWVAEAHPVARRSVQA